MNDPVGRIDPQGLIWQTAGTEYQTKNNILLWLMNRLRDNIASGWSSTLPGSSPSEYDQMTRNIIQEWVPDPDHPELDCKHPIGTRRIRRQTFVPTYDDLQNKDIYAWQPGVPYRTYQEWEQTWQNVPPSSGWAEPHWSNADTE